MQLDLIVGSTTYSLTNGAPYSLEAAEGLAMPPVKRFSRRFPGQDGYDDLGHVLEPRTIMLSLLFTAATQAALDGHRDTLQSVFGPGTNMPLVLQATRDDGKVRRLDVTATGLSVVPVDPAHRPGRLHRAAIKLRAADPIWYSASPGTVTFGTADPTTWYLASNLIPQSAVIDARTNPGTAVVVNVSHTSGQTFMFRGILGTARAVGETIYEHESLDDPIISFAKVALDGTTKILQSSRNFAYIGTVHSRVTTMDNNQYTIIMCASQDVSVQRRHVYGYVNGTVVYEQYLGGYPEVYLTKIRWRHDRNGNVWGGSLSHVAAYRISLSDAQAVALTNALGGIFANASFISGLDNDGNYESFPVISLTGPLANPVVRQLETNKKLDFTGATIPAGVVYTIDLRQDALSVVDSGGTVRTTALTDNSDLGSWYLPPGSCNVAVTSTLGDANSRVQIVHTPRYVSY